MLNKLQKIMVREKMWTQLLATFDLVDEPYEVSLETTGQLDSLRTVATRLNASSPQSPTRYEVKLDYGKLTATVTVVRRG